MHVVAVLDDLLVDLVRVHPRVRVRAPHDVEEVLLRMGSGMGWEGDHGARLNPAKHRSTSRRPWPGRLTRNCAEKSSTNLSGDCPNNMICRLCPSEVRWHLKPLASRHCFLQSSQYHRSFCSPFALMALAICLCIDFSFPISSPHRGPRA